jgi:hypothetical protein
MMTSCSSEFFEGNDDKAADHMANLFGPGHVDQAVRNSISACWMALPKDRKTPEALEQEVRRLFERALKDFREDCVAFGKSK